MPLQPEEESKQGDERKAEEGAEQEERDTKVRVREEEPKGEKRGLDGWEEMAERLKDKAAKRAREMETKKENIQFSRAK